MTQLTIIGSRVASTSSNPFVGWECTFRFQDKVLPSDSYVRTWRNGLRGQGSNSLERALLLLADLEHYSGCQDEDLILKLKWHNIAMSFCYSELLLFSFAHFLFSCPLFFTGGYIHFNLYQFQYSEYADPRSFLLLSQVAQLTHVVEGRLKCVMEEVDMEKALKQVAEVNLKEKTLELNVVE